jgi:micrococcal nuclease
MVLSKIHQRFLKLFGATFFKPEKMANIMESTHQKTHTELRTILTIAAVLVFILLLYPALSAASQFKVARITNGDTNKANKNDNKSTIRLACIDAPETSKKRNEPGQPFNEKSIKHLASRVLNKSFEIKSYGNDRCGRILGVVFVDGKNVNLEMAKAGMPEVYRGRPLLRFDNDPYWKTGLESCEAGLGMWSLGDRYVSPREWRKLQKECLTNCDYIYVSVVRDKL